MPQPWQAIAQQFFVDGVINAHTQQPDNADNHAENKHSSTTVADNLHGKAHPDTKEDLDDSAGNGKAAGIKKDRSILAGA